MDLHGKTLLVLGGYPLMIKVIEKARELGATVLCTDWNEDAPAKAAADRAFTVSTTDVDALEKLCRREHVDGVFPGAVDVNLVPAAKLCERLGLPCYASAEQFSRTLSKLSFKEDARACGMPVAQSWNADNLDSVDTASLPYPLIVKPADCYSSRGISVCDGPANLAGCVERARETSPSGRCIVEEFLEGDDVYLYFTVQDGRASLSAMADRLTMPQRGEGIGLAPQPQLYVFPSRYLDLYEEQAAESVQRLVELLGLRQGSFMLQGIVSQGQLRFFEMGLRMTGGAGFLLIRHLNGIDQCEMHIRYALGQPFGPWDAAACDNARFDSPACVLVPLLRAGAVGSVSGLDAIEGLPSYVDSIVYLHEGDEVGRMGTLDQALARIYLAGADKESLLEDLRKAKEALSVRSADGEDMLVPWFDDAEAARCLA